jgi:hypothetical protein
MLNANRLRISLAVVTLAGAFHLDRAHAAAPASAGPCDSYVHGYAAGYCASTGKKPASIIFTCHLDGTVTVHEVTCHEPT